jgi:hypothetical protein
MKRIACGAFFLMLAGQIANAQLGSNLTPLNNVQILTPSGPIKGLKPANTGGAVKGIVQVAVKLQDPPLVVAVGANAKQLGIAMSDQSVGNTTSSGTANRPTTTVSGDFQPRACLGKCATSCTRHIAKFSTLSSYIPPTTVAIVFHYLQYPSQNPVWHPKIPPQVSKTVNYCTSH